MPQPPLLEGRRQEHRQHQRTDKPQHDRRLPAALETRELFHVAPVRRVEHGEDDGQRGQLLQKGEGRVERPQRQVRSRREALPNQVERPELEDDEAVEHHHVHDAALLVLEQLFLPKHLRPHAAPARAPVACWRYGPPQLDKGVARAHDIDKERDGIGRDQ